MRSVLECGPDMSGPLCTEIILTSKSTNHCVKHPRLKISDQFALTWFTAWSVITFLTFGFDKWRAGRSGSRTPESFLCLLGAIGGWPGGLLGMLVFRHKTAKWTFKFKYTLALLPFAAEVYAWLHWR